MTDQNNPPAPVAGDTGADSGPVAAAFLKDNGQYGIMWLRPVPFVDGKAALFVGDAGAAPEGWAAEFLAKRLGRVAKLIGYDIPDHFTHEQTAEAAGTILGAIARLIEERKLKDAERYELAGYEWVHPENGMQLTREEPQEYEEAYEIRPVFVRIAATQEAPQ